MRNVVVALVLVAACGPVKGNPNGNDVDAPACDSAQSLCGDTCFNTDNDPEHCGGCDPCDLQNASAGCVDGQCTTGLCSPGFCDADGLPGCEVQPNFQTDLAHCGGCNVECTGVCGGGVCSQRIFITANTIPANFGGLVGGDALCQNEATANQLSGTWKVWAGDATDGPSTRNTKKGPYIRASDGVKIADDFDDLADGNLDNPVLKTANGTTPPIGQCWTNVAIGGGPGGSGSCSNWTSTASALSGTRNQHNLSSGMAGVGGSQNCDPAVLAPARLYCVEQ
jgi:hypothetical protein